MEVVGRRKFLLLKEAGPSSAGTAELLDTATEFLRGLAAKPDQKRILLGVPSFGVDESYAKLLSIIAASSDATNKIAEQLLSRPPVVERIVGGYRWLCLLCPRQRLLSPLRLETALDYFAVHRIGKHRMLSTSSPLIAVRSRNNKELVIDFDELFHQIQVAVSNYPQLRQALGLDSKSILFVALNTDKDPRKVRTGDMTPGNRFLGFRFLS